ncbi:MAG: hypothetical protein NTX22_08900 [Ignavibacteriales bacterium]|nr:hypothetical protein [Ignavibacteriales bacterium]
MKQNIISKLILPLFLLVGLSCSDGPTDPHKYPINPYLKEIKFSNPNRSGNFYMAVWRGNTIFAIQPFSQFIVDNGYNVAEDKRLEPDTTSQPWTYIDANSLGTKILLVEAHIGGVSAGALYEYDVLTKQLQLIYDNNYNVASARYYPNDDNKIIYYKYGDNTIKTAGYYLYDKITNKDSLLFPYLSTAGWWETLHGFDIHPNGDTLLIPISLCVGQLDHAKPPKLGIISLQKQKIDTLDISFNISYIRTGLWLRYNHDGSKILYCCFPDNAYGFVTNDNSEVGIIESSTLTKTILDVNTNDESEYGSVQLAPNWSPDEKAIVFGSSQVAASGQAGFRHLYILSKIN